MSNASNHEGKANLIEDKKQQIEKNLLEKELHIRTSDFEKGFIAIQQLTEVLKLSKKMRIIIDYDPQKAMTEIRYIKIGE